MDQRWKPSRWLASIAVLAAMVALPCGAPAQTTNKIRLGINADANLDFDGADQFADAMMSSRGWCPLNSAQGDNKPHTTVDANGWPMTDASAYVWAGRTGKTYLNGTYKLSFNGKATISVSLVTATVTNQLYDSANNRTTADVTVSGVTDGPQTACVLNLSGTQRTATSAMGTGVTNVKLMRPGYSSGTLFTSHFLNLMQHAQVIRFMDWCATNGNAQANWSDRTIPSTYSQAASADGYGWQGKGSCWEYAVALCNATNCDLWVNVPISATDDYVTKLAQLIRYGSDGNLPYTSAQASPVWAPLNSGLKVYVEYSNETWNFSAAFTQYGAEIADARALVNAGDPNHYAYDGQSQDFTIQRRRHADRTRQISLKFREVFGDAAMMTRVRPLLLSQKANIFTLATMLKYLDDIWNNRAGSFTSSPHPVSYYLYGGGGSGYDEEIPDSYMNSNSLTLDQLFGQAYPQSWAGWDAHIRPEVDRLAGYGLKRVVYEGGPGLDPNNHSDIVKEDQAYADARIKDVTQNMVTRFFENGGELWMHFNSAGNIVHGLLLDGHDATSYKLQGFDAAAAQASTTPTYGPAIPTTLNAGLWNFRNDDFSTASTTTGAVTVSGSQFYAYTFRAPTSGATTVTLNGSGGTVRVLLDGSTDLGALTLPSASGLAMNLAVGIHSLRVEAVTGATTLNSITFGTGGTPTASAPTFSPAPGTFTTAQVVTLSTSTPGATIRYTLDGTAPGASSPVYSSPINVSATTTVKAIAMASGYANSSVSTGTYTISSGSGGSTGGGTGSTNLVVNAGYESSLQNWFGGGSYQVTTDAHTGTKACIVNGWWASNFQSVNGLSPNTQYTVTVWAKASDGNGNVDLYVANYGGATIHRSVTATTWTQVSISFTTGASGTSVLIGAEELNGTASSITVDDWSILSGSTTTDPGGGTGDNPTGTNLLANSGYENSLQSWFGGGNYSISADAHGGTKACLVNNWYSSVFQTAKSLSPNTRYTLTVWAKASDASGSVQIYAKGFGGTDITRTVTSTGWMQITIGFTTGSAGTQAEVGAASTAGNGATIVVDDWALVQG